MELTERVQSPLIAGVVFLDIVGYSRLTVEAQFTVKKHFNRHIGDALQDEAADARLILDTGDGAAVCYFARPESALLSAIRLRHATMFESAEDARYELRTGINLGPVRVIRDLNGQRNVVGDGINDAQRIMSFAEPSQILASGSFFDHVSRGRHDHARLFTYLGVRHDKHVKEHLVYEIGASSAPGRARTVSADTRRSDVQWDREAAATRSATSGWPGKSGDLPAARWAPDPGLQEQARAALARFVGPVADAMIRRAAQSATSPSEFHLRLAAGIESDDDRMAFLETVGALGRSRR